MGSVLLAVPAYFDHPGPERERRRSKRRELRLGLGAASEGVMILNISATGMLIESQVAMLLGTRFTVELPHLGPIGAQVVWNRGEFYGCEFDHSIPAAAVSAALLLGKPVDPSEQAAAEAPPPPTAPERTGLDPETGAAFPAAVSPAEPMELTSTHRILRRLAGRMRYESTRVAEREIAMKLLLMATELEAAAEEMRLKTARRN